MTSICMNQHTAPVASEIARCDPMVRKMNGALARIRLVYHIFHMERRSRKSVTALRSIFAECKSSCEHSCTCASDVLGAAREMRNSFRLLLINMEKVPTPLFVQRRILAIEDDWDNLVEDLAIASDEEIKTMAGQLAHFI
ncbi:hypothetical protein DDE01_06530 [Desulfovibrio desulfuricans]|nr:hypothetical protein DDE01_06530 [Desulfovibrio desulfuricans]